MKNTIKLLAPLAGTLIVTIIALTACSPKKSVAPATQTVTETQNAAGVTAAFEMDGTTLVKYTGNETSVTIPNSVTLIGEYAFAENQLTSVTIPNSVIEISRYAFSRNQLTNVIIPNSVATIGDSAFSINQLTSVVIPNSVTEISYEAFSGNQLTSVIIPNSVTLIGMSAFRNNQLTNITIPFSVTYIDETAFHDNQLTNIIIPNSVTYIGGSAFTNNPLTSITIGTNVELFEADYRYDAPFGDGFTNVYNNNGKRAGTYIYSDGQWRGHQAQSADFQINGTTLVKYIGNDTHVTIPSSVTMIGDRAFGDCKNLTSVTIPSSVPVIGAEAFGGCNLTSITLSRSTMVEYGNFDEGWQLHQKAVEIHYRD
jgi:hypothetical protein